MSEPQTCLPDPRLVAHYHRCLLWRVQWWFGSSGWLEALSDRTWRLGHGTKEVTITWQPQRCCWTVPEGSGLYCGSFDRVSKRARQKLSGRG